MESKEELLKQLRIHTIRWIELDHRYKDLLFAATGKVEDERPTRTADAKWCSDCDGAAAESDAAHAKVVETRGKLAQLASQP